MSLRTTHKEEKTDKVFPAKAKHNILIFAWLSPVNEIYLLLVYFLESPKNFELIQNNLLFISVLEASFHIWSRWGWAWMLSRTPFRYCTSFFLPEFNSLSLLISLMAGFSSSIRLPSWSELCFCCVLPLICDLFFVQCFTETNTCHHVNAVMYFVKDFKH